MGEIFSLGWEVIHNTATPLLMWHVKYANYFSCFWLYFQQNCTCNNALRVVSTFGLNSKGGSVPEFCSCSVRVQLS